MYPKRKLKRGLFFRMKALKSNRTNRKLRMSCFKCKPRLEPHLDVNRNLGMFFKKN